MKEYNYLVLNAWSVSLVWLEVLLNIAFCMVACVPLLVAMHNIVVSGILFLYMQLTTATQLCLKRYTQADHDHVLLILELVKVKRRFLTIANMTEQYASMLIYYVCSF